MTKMTLEQVRDWHRVVASENAERRALCSPNGERWELWNDEFNKQVAMADAIDAHLAKGAQEWQPIETAPTGAKGYAWMLLAWGPDEDKSVSNGMRCGDRFFAAPSFYCMGQERQFQQREIEVFPTHWMPLPDAPMLSQRGEVES
jgi:hypothetical protein